MQYKKIKCTVCGEEIGSSGVGFTSHMRAHVRANEAQEFQRGQKLFFISNKEAQEFLDKEPIAKLGNEPLLGQIKDAWDLTEALSVLKPINPRAYFITSGEAVKKADKLVKDLYTEAVKARSFRDKLKKARGAKKYLESGWDNNRCICKSKDPRNKNIVEEVND